jgi:triacylglycerol lipase
MEMAERDMIASGAQATEHQVRAHEAIRRVVEVAGVGFSPDVLQSTIDGLTSFQLPTEEYALVQRDVPYGPDPRHRFDWFKPAGVARSGAAVIFVHGGGFVGGDKQDLPPLYGNVGYWAASNGLDAAILNYRLAPGHVWPAGGEDVRLAIEAVVQTLRQDGVASPKIFLVGHSAGAVHAATSLTIETPPAEVAGCVLISGFYDNTKGRPNPAYFGEDPSVFESQSSLRALAGSAIPLLLVVAELDPPLMHSNAVELMRERLIAEAPLPRFQVLLGHNHFSPAMLFNSSIDTLGPNIVDFIKQNS